MAIVIARSAWTGTAGVLDSGLPEDWDEAFMELREKSFDSKEVSYSPEFVAAVWTWARQELGKDAHKMSVLELAEYWYEFA